MFLVVRQAAPLALQRLSAIESRRRQLLGIIVELPPAQWDTHPRPGKWSIREIIEHLVISEVSILGTPSDLETRPPLQQRLRDRVRYLVVMAVLRFNIPVGVPSDAMLPISDVPLHDLRLQWERQHEQLRGWIERGSTADLVVPRFRHPVAGPMTVTQALGMLEVHLARHARQVRALIRLMQGAHSA